MTHLTNYPTKKALKEALKTNPDEVFFEDPSIFDPISGTAQIILKTRDYLTVTNHKRRWFACIRYGRNNNLVIE